MEGILTALSSINAVADLLAKATKVAKDKKDIELLSIIAEIQSEFIVIRENNNDLRKKLDLSDKIERHSDGLYVTLRDDDAHIRYCSTCWGNCGKLVQIGNRCCPVCKTYLLGYEKNFELIKNDEQKVHIL